MQEATLLWAAQQGQWLQALGYTVYRLGDAPQAAPEIVVDAPPRRADVPAVDSHPVQAAPSRMPAADTPGPRQAPSPERIAASSGTSAAGARVAGSMRRPALPDRLQLALLRISGLDPSDPATHALMDTWPVAGLRGDAAAKRAFWPTLRALRKSRR